MRLCDLPLADIQEYATQILSKKGLMVERSMQLAVTRRLAETLRTTYHAAALDIDGTITAGGDDPIPPTLVDAIADLLSRGMYVVLITGSGVQTAKVVVRQLTTKLGNPSPSQFRLFAIADNGGRMLVFPPGGEPETLTIVEPVAEVLGKKAAIRIHEELRDRFESEFNVSTTDWGIRLASRTPNPANAAELRLLVESWYESQYKKLQPRGVRLVQGRWRDYLTFEVTTADKEFALSWFYTKYDFLDVPLLRVGDQGGPGGNDFSLLDSEYGFSVNATSANPLKCFPVWDSKRRVFLSGVDATEFLLRGLNWTPRLTLPSSLVARSEEEYRQVFPRLRGEAKRVLGTELEQWATGARDILDPQSIESAVQSSFSTVLDPKSGGVVFDDREWASLPDSKFKDYFDADVVESDRVGKPGAADHPLKLRRLATDSRQLLRGPAYYIGLAFKPGPGQLVRLCQELDSEMALLEESVILDAKNSRQFVMWKAQLAFLDSMRNHALLFHTALFTAASVQSSLQMYWRKLVQAHEPFVSAVVGLYYAFLTLDTDSVPALLQDWRLSSAGYFTARNAASILFEFLKKANIEEDKVVRKWREADHPGQILATMKMINTEISGFPRRSGRTVGVGLMDGAVELPFVLRYVRSRYSNATTTVAHLGGVSFYRRGSPSPVMQQFSKEILEAAIGNAERLEEVMSPGDSVVLLDDNVMSGRTIELARDRFTAYGVHVPLIGCVRFPGEGRIPQMMMKGHGGIDPLCLGRDVKGLVAQSPYARIFSASSGDYRDITGNFDLARARIQRYLRKNGTLFAED